MSTSCFQPSSTASCRHVPDVVFRSLKSALALQCRRRHDVEVTITRLDQATDDPSIRLRVGCDDQIQLTAQISVSPVGGNVYDIDCTVEEGPSCQFTYSLPGRSGTALSRAPDLGRRLGAFLLDELERQVGRHYLQSQ